MDDQGNNRTVGEVITEWTKTFGLLLDYLKVTRRTVLVVYGYFLYETSQWFFSLPDPTTQQVTYVTAILGLAGIIFGFYSNSPSDYVKLDNAKNRQYDSGRSSRSGRSNYSRNDRDDQQPDYRNPDNNRNDLLDASQDDGFWDDSER